MIQLVKKWWVGRQLNKLRSELAEFEDGLKFWRRQFEESPDPLTAMNLGYVRYTRDELDAKIRKLLGDT